MAGAVANLGGTEAPGGGQDVDRLQEAGLAGAVPPEKEVRSRSRLPREGLQVTEVAEDEMGEHRGGRLLPPGRAVETADLNGQIRIGMITQR
jgi:hypothetical protein